MLRVGGGTLICNTLDDAVTANRLTGSAHHVVFSMGSRKYFSLMKSTYDIITLPSKLCLCEVLLNNTGRVYIDFDDDVAAHIDLISNTLTAYITAAYGHKSTCTWKWSNGTVKHWHCIVSGVYFDNCWIDACRDVCTHLQNQLSLTSMDTGVYRTNAMLRVVGQDKLVDGEYTKRLHPYTQCTMADLSILPTTTDIRCTSSATSTITRAVHSNPISHVTRTAFTLPSEFRIHQVYRNPSGDTMVKLRRVSSSYCQICRRIHDRIGAYVVVRDVSVEYRCYRSPVYNTGQNLCVVYDR